MNRASWLIHLHPRVFAIPLGLFGLAGAGRRASGFGWHAGADVGPAIATLALVPPVLVALTLQGIVAMRVVTILATGRLLPEAH
jgi:hypothetical protein